jgi:hypothetical protein
MIVRPKISRNERKTTEIGAFEVGNFAPFCCPGAVVGASEGSGWFAEAEPSPSEIDSHATSHVSVRAPPPLPDDDASARTSAVSRESSFRGSFRGSFRASSRGSLYRGGSSRGSMRASMYQGKRLTMKRTSTILEPFIVQCGGEDELDAEHAKPSLEFATLLGEIARAEEMHVAAQINFIVRAAEKADDEAKFRTGQQKRAKFPTSKAPFSAVSTRFG